MRWRAFPSILLAILALGLGTLVGAHTFVEVQSRYHFYWTPFFCALAGIGARRLWERLSPCSA